MKLEVAIPFWFNAALRFLFSFFSWGLSIFFKYFLFLNFFSALSFFFFEVFDCVGHVVGFFSDTQKVFLNFFSLSKLSNSEPNAQLVCFIFSFALPGQ